MTYQKLEDLPNDVKELPQHGQQLFMAAYNAVSENGMNEDNASQVAWNSVKNSYQKGQDGNWVSIENSNIDRANVTGTDIETSDPIGNRENNAGTMRGG